MGNLLIRSPVTLWTNGSTILGSELAGFDANLAQSINGVDGGTWSPTSPIQFFGSGFQNFGPTVVCRGGQIFAQVAGGFFLNDGDYPQYLPGHSARTPSRMHSFLGGLPSDGAQVGKSPVWRVRSKDGGLQAIAPVVDQGNGAGPQVAGMSVPFRAHNGATLSSVTINFRVSTPHTQLPGTMPTARVYRRSATGNIDLLTSKAAGADTEGRVSVPTPASPVAWYNLGSAQQLTITCDQNNVIDVTRFTYWVEVRDEKGIPGYPFTLVFKQPCIAVAQANIKLGALTDLVGALNNSIDGIVDQSLVGPAQGARVLVKAQTDATLNGIWVANVVASTSWTRAFDLTLASDFVQGMVVPVGTLGVANGGTYWQAQSTITSWSGNASTTPTQLAFVSRGLDDDETPATAGTQFFAHGTIWQSFSTAYTGVTQASFE